MSSLQGCLSDYKEEKKENGIKDEIGADKEFKNKVESINEKALLWLDTLDVDPIRLRYDMGIKGKKKFVELLSIYLCLYQTTDDNNRKKMLKDKVESLTTVTNNPLYHDLNNIDDKQFRQDSTSYFRAWYMMNEFGLNTSYYLEEIEKIMPRIYSHLPDRGINQKMAFVFYFKRLGYSINYTMKQLFDQGVIRTQKSVNDLSNMEVYYLTHEIFFLYDDDKMDLLSKNDIEYLNENLPFLIHKYIGYKNVDLLAELIMIMTYLKFTDLEVYRIAIEFLLNSQNENGSFGDYEEEREYYENKGSKIDVDYLLYLHTTEVTLMALNEAVK